jgi:hypothetical protein
LGFGAIYVGNKNGIWKGIPGSQNTWSIICISNPHEISKTNVTYTL